MRMTISYVFNTESHSHVGYAKDQYKFCISCDIMKTKKTPTLNHVSNVL